MIGSNRVAIKTIPGQFLWLALLIFALGCQPSIPPTAALPSQGNLPGSRHYLVHQQVTLDNQGPGRPQKQNLWVALIRDFPPYQKVESMQVSPPDYTLVTDEYGNQYAEFDFSGQPANTTRSVTIDYRVTVNQIDYDLSQCDGPLLAEFIQPELHIESANPQIVALAKQLSQGKNTVCQQVRAFYDYVGDELVYTFNGQNWGAQAALGPMGADCTEYADLLAALSRAQGIPARYFEGLLALGQSTDELAKTEHAWADVYLPSVDWVAMDPTLGRAPLNRETYFAHYTPDHIIVTLGASPSVLRDSSYWTHLYWPGDSTRIQTAGEWKIEPAGQAGGN